MPSTTTADDREQRPDDRTRELITATNDGATALNTGFTRFVTIAVYIAITLASATDEQLLRGGSVNLPLVDTAIPITGPFGFCMLAPMLILGLHVSLLAQLETLMSRVAEAQSKHVGDRITAPYYVRFLVRADRRGTVVPALTLLGTMVIIPLLLLLSIQVRFLPLHNVAMTRAHQVFVLLDVGITLVILRRALAAGAKEVDAERSWRAFVGRLASPWTAVSSAGVAMVGFSLVANFSHGRDAWLFGRRNLLLEGKVLTEDKLSAEHINTLRDGTPAARENILRTVSRLSVLQGQDLRYANLRRAILPAVDFRSERIAAQSVLNETIFEEADLSWAIMPQILLDDVNLRHATLQNARMQGGILNRANLDGADLQGAELQDAKLWAARLRSATLQGANLTGADLSHADLRDADLSGVHAQAAILREADLRGADLRDADLRGADLSRARLQGTKLAGALLNGAIVRGIVVRDVFHRPCKLRDGPTLASTEEPLTFDGCRATTVAEAACENTDAVCNSLAHLACEDAYVARGLTAQIGYGAPGRQGLAQALVSAGADQGCSGVRLLADPTRAALDREAKRPRQAPG